MFGLPFDNDVSAVDDSGHGREPYLERLKWLVAECDRRKIVVDVTLTRGEGRLGNVHVATLDAHLRALETLASELKPWRNWYVDVANEHNLRSKTVASKFVPIEEARRLRDGVKRVDDRRLVTISYVGDVSKDEVRRYVFEAQVDFLSPHRPRNARSPCETQRGTQQYLFAPGSVYPMASRPAPRGHRRRGWPADAPCRAGLRLPTGSRPERYLDTLQRDGMNYTRGCSGSAQDAGMSRKAIDPVDDAEVELTLVQEGMTIKLYRGGIYRVNEQSGQWGFVAEGYDPDYYDSITLSEQTDGVVELWQDGAKIVDRRGQTLPLSHTIYNSLEVGISAHSIGPQPATLYVDDVSISGQPLD